VKILLTGGSGMVGRNFLEHPHASKWNVLAPRRAELDLFDGRAVERFIERERPDVVVHAAGRVGGIQANIKEPVAFLLENLDMGRNVVLGARKGGVKKLLNLGSSCMYPRNIQTPLTENMVLKGELEPTNEGYALAKVAVARLCEFISREDGELRYKTIIPCNLFGRWDKFDPAHSHLIASVVHKLHAAKSAGKAEVDIWGDGLARREFLFAGDLADFMVRALERFDELPALMNVGVGRDHTINEYYGTAARVVGWEGTFTHDLSRPVGMSRKLVDASRQAAFGWQPKTSLEEGIAKTYEFYLNQVPA
jgi:GDP-L-fucose synthase